MGKAIPGHWYRTDIKKYQFTSAHCQALSALGSAHKEHGSVFSRHLLRGVVHAQTYKYFERQGLLITESDGQVRLSAEFEELWYAILAESAEKSNEKAIKAECERSWIMLLQDVAREIGRRVKFPSDVELLAETMFPTGCAIYTIGMSGSTDVRPPHAMPNYHGIAYFSVNLWGPKGTLERQNELLDTLKNTIDGSYVPFTLLKYGCVQFLGVTNAYEQGGRLISEWCLCVAKDKKAVEALLRDKKYYGCRMSFRFKYRREM